MLSEKAISQKAEAEGPLHENYNKLAVVSSMIRRADDGEKHATLLKAAILCGGYIAVGRMEEKKPSTYLSERSSSEDVDSIETARHTIRDGIEKGKTMPHPS